MDAAEDSFHGVRLIVLEKLPVDAKVQVTASAIRLEEEATLIPVNVWLDQDDSA